MNFKLIVPVMLVVCLLVVVPVSASSKWFSDYENKYNPNVGSKYDISQDPNTYSGRAEVIIRSHQATLNPTLILANAVNPNVTKKIAVEDSGLNTINDLPPGEFIITLDNYDVPDETQRFTIAAGLQEPTRIVFIGQASGGIPQKKCVIDIKSVSYGMITQVCEEVLITPARTEYRVRGHWDYEWSWNQGWHYDWDHSNWWSEWSSDFPFRYGQIPSNDKQSREVPAHYHTVCHNEGSYADVTQQVKQVVASGYSTFVFSNGWVGNYFGGIYNNEQSKTLLAQIEDPAKGQVKDVTISYIGCDGNDKNLKTKEYQQITL